MTIDAIVQDKAFLKYLEKTSKELQTVFSVEELILLEKIRVGNVKEIKIAQIKRLLDLGIVEIIGRTRGKKIILSHKYYATMGRTGVHTRLAGISREQKKQLILNHISKKGKGYIKEFMDVFPEMNRNNIAKLLQELKQKGKIISKGEKRTGYWELK